MFEALVERLLNKILGEYIEGFSSENLKIGIWSGQVILKNVALKRSIIKMLNLPFKVKYSRIGCLKLIIPWKSLTSSKIEVLLEGLEVVIAELPEADWECKNTKIVERRKQQIESLCESVLADFLKKTDKDKQSDGDGYFSKLIVKIIDNLQLTIKDIHIRYEDEISKRYSFGVTLEEFKLYTVNAKGESEYIDRNKPEYANEPLRKKLELSNLGIYWNEKSWNFPSVDYETHMRSTIAKRGQTTFSHNYLILGSMQANLLQRQPGKQYVQPEIDLEITLQDLKLEITNTQLQQIISLGERLQRYTNKVREQNREQLSKEIINSNREYFRSIFPKYYNGFGSNLTGIQLNKVEEILEKMEVENFTKDITQFLQDRQRERVIKEKKQKNKGWFWNKPKELSTQQLQEVENYLNNNFGQQVKIVKRPLDYHYAKITFRLNKLEVVVANTQSFTKEGVQSRFENQIVHLALREGGYQLDMIIEDIAINMFKQIGVQLPEYKQILYKLHQQKSKQDNSYLKLQMAGNPLDKKHLDAEVKLTTSELMILFDPKIISLALDFANLNVNKANRQAAVEKFGEIKEITETAVSESIEKPTKAQIGVDIVIRSCTVAIPFSPHRQDSDIWGLNLGSVHFTTDQQTLLQVEVLENLPLNVFHLELKSFSFRHYQNLSHFKQCLMLQSTYDNITHAVIDNLDFRLRVDIFSRATETRSKINLHAILPELHVNLNVFTYKYLLKLGDAFATEQKLTMTRETARIQEKKQIQQKSAKIGFVCIKDNLTKIWKKYVAIMSENYIYLFLNKNDKDYYAYYYIKGAQLDKYTEPLDKQKPYHFKIKNKVNQVVFGFDKEEQIDDWIVKIEALTKEREKVEQVNANAPSVIGQQVKEKKHNQLNLYVSAEIESIYIKVYLTQSLQDKVVRLHFLKLTSKISLYESKKIIGLTLFSLELQDTIERYKKKDLVYFLQTKHKQMDENLINIGIQQLNREHPEYDHTDSSIDVSFGTLSCNYKCETVKALMAFFIPPPSEKEEEIGHQSLQSEIASNSVSLIAESSIDYQIYSLKLKLKIEEISVTLVNQKIKTVIGVLGITNLNLYTGISQKRMSLIGSLKDLYYIDTTSYPNTIYTQQQEYENKRTILTANIGQNKNMLDFNIEILKALNQYQKNMLIDIKLANLTTYYVQQPVLRLITYLNTQMLPSFETGPKQSKIVAPKDTKPEPATMDLRVELTNISVFVETEHQFIEIQKQEFIQLNIQRITVQNESFYRDYTNTKPKKPIILVQNYLVKLYSMSIAVRYFDLNKEQHRYKLTNNLDLTVSTDLIANPEYYKKEIPEMFDNGLRLSCQMTPFFMRMNHDDYSFIMKCLNWGITHNDGLENDLFDIPVARETLDNEQKNKNVQPPKDPFYLNVKMDCISLFITQNNLPIAFLELDSMLFTFSAVEDITQMQLIMKRLYGTSISHDKEEKTMTERGIFNSLGFTAKHPIEDLTDLESFIKLFDLRQKLAESQSSTFLTFGMIITQKSSDISIQMSELWIDVDLRLIMILSSLANTDEKYIKGPQPIKINEIQKEVKEKALQSQPKTPPKKFTLIFVMKKLVGSVSDSTKQKFAIIEGEIFFNMINYGDKSIEEIEEINRQRQNQKSISHSSISAYLKNFTAYFSKVQKGQIVAKREFLQPMTIDFDQKRYYHLQKEFHILSTDIRLKTDALLLTASLKDMLNINKILQDNMNVLGEFQSKPKQEIQPQVVEKQDMQQVLLKISEKMLRQIQSTTKIIGEIAPIQIDIVNDCDSNFMPVIRLIIQDTQPLMKQNLICSQLFIVPIINLHFFNPRSSRWQPIIQPFKTTINYNTVTLNKEQAVSINIKTDSLSEETSSLKVNISTQMLSTIMAATDIIKAQKENIDKNIESKSIEVSPFIFHNITNEKIYILRKDNEFEVNPLFKGPIRISNDKGNDKEILFRIKDKVHKFSTDHYGVLRIPQTNYFIKFDTEKLSRIIKFIPPVFIKNRLQQAIFVRVNGGEIARKVENNEWIPLDNIESFAISLNGNSYTQQTPTNSLKLAGFIMAEKKNFLILLKYKQNLNNYAVVDLLPPFVVYNCLPKHLNLQFILKAKTKSTITVNSQQSYSIFTSEDVGALEIKATVAGYTWSKKFKFRQEKDGVESQLELGDEGNYHTILNYLFKRDKNSNQYVLTIYCKKIIINELCDKLIVYGNFEVDEKDKKMDRFMLLGGQKKSDDAFDDKIIMVGEEVGNKIRVCGSHSVFDFATPISIGGLGESQARIVVDREYEGEKDSLFTIIGVQISAIKMTKECDIFCKKIVLKSKSIIINTTKRDLVIQQELANKYKFTSEAGTRKNFVVGMPDIQGRQYKYTFRTQGFLPSKLINLPTQGTTYFKLQSLEQKDEKGIPKCIYYKIYVKGYQAYSFYEISQITSEDFPYEIIVKSKNVQVFIPSLNRCAVKGDICRFINENEQDQLHLVDLIIKHSESKEEIKMRVCPDDLKYKEKDLLRVQRGGLIGSIAILVQVTISDKQRSIVIDELSRVQEEKEVQQSALSIDIAEIILSINQNSQSIEVPYESMVITLRRLLFIKYETDKKRQYQLKLGYLQIDQAYPHIISSPVILTPYKYQEFNREKDPKSIFNFTIVFNKQFVKNTFINEVCVDFDDIVATFSADFINLVTLIAKQFGEVINFKQATYFIDKKVEKWQEIILPPEEKIIFIRSIKIAPFIIDLSAQLNIKKLNLQNNLLLSTIISTVGIVMSNIDCAPIEMNGIEINDCIDTVDSITNKLVTHYKQTCIKQFYKIFGSLNIIGNPLSLFRNISTGVKDLREKPAKGFVNGPAEFGLGIAQGTGSLVAHSVGGALNSISKVTGTFSTGLATLAFDKEFEEHREKEKMKKPQNVIQGLEKGGKAIFYGFKEGITGVFTQPIENARKEGALGFVKGAAKGLAGLVVKPVTGIIDFASKTTQGIKNNALMFEDKAHEERMRNPRVFYSECFILKEYNPRDSALFAILKRVENEQKFQNPVFVDAYDVQGGKLFLIILTSGIVYLDASTKKVKWGIDYSQLQIENLKQKKMLSFKKKGKSSTFFSSNDYDVVIEDDPIRDIVAEVIISLQKEKLHQ